MKMFVILTYLFVLVGCGGPKEEVDNPDVSDPKMQALMAAKSLWDAQAYTSYRFDLQRSCFCLNENNQATVVVDDGQVTSLYSGSGFLATDHFLAISIEDLFAEIESALQSATADATVTYNPDYGYPETVALDRIVLAADDEMYYSISNVYSPSKQLQEAEEQAGLWHSQNITSYNMVFSLSCFCPQTGEISVDVVDGELSQAIFVASGNNLDEATVQAFPMTVEQMLAFIQEQLSATAIVTVTYSELGYPTAIAVDRHPLLADDSISIQVKSVH